MTLSQPLGQLGRFVTFILQMRKVRPTLRAGLGDKAGAAGDRSRAGHGPGHTFWGASGGTHADHSQGQAGSCEESRSGLWPCAELATWQRTVLVSFPAVGKAPVSTGDRSR